MKRHTYKVIFSNIFFVFYIVFGLLLGFFMNVQKGNVVSCYSKWVSHTTRYLRYIPRTTLIFFLGFSNILSYFI